MDAVTKIDQPTGKARSWWRRPSPLGIVFVGLVALSIGKQVVEAWPRPPRVVAENLCPDAIGHLIVEGPSGTVDLGVVLPRGRAQIPIDFRPGETYVIHGHEATGDEIVRQLQIARKDGGDVVIRIRWNPEGYPEVLLGGGYLPVRVVAKAASPGSRP